MSRRQPPQSMLLLIVHIFSLSTTDWLSTAKSCTPLATNPGLKVKINILHPSHQRQPEQRLPIQYQQTELLFCIENCQLKPDTLRVIPITRHSGRALASLIGCIFQFRQGKRPFFVLLLQNSLYHPNPPPLFPFFAGLHILCNPTFSIPSPGHPVHSGRARASGVVVQLHWRHG